MQSVLCLFLLDSSIQTLEQLRCVVYKPYCDLIVTKNKNNPGLNLLPIVDNTSNNSFTYNRFELLENVTDDSMDVKPKLRKSQLIIILNVSKIKKLYEMLAKLTTLKKIAKELQTMGHEMLKLPYDVKHRVTLYQSSSHDYIQKYCIKTSKYMKYTEYHLLTTRKIKNGNIKCVNYGEKHLANYKGCIAYITAWRRKYKSYNTYRSYDTSVKTQQYRSEGLSYASVTTQLIKGTTEKENMNKQTMDNCMQHKNEEIIII
ncbi:hypothetical protein HZH68_010177 [Vespula germanica]|uniref:Uncharacterized protein n=1 Tax=Vespula germanica TaxID=30212 RepID=A0A834JR27_VESGE|nr:hypothetical protein HZH68_010177 [Vespula germanica]